MPVSMQGHLLKKILTVKYQKTYISDYLEIKSVNKSVRLSTEFKEIIDLTK